ncbi:MAG: hypothetical protein ACYTDT_04635 [Planctomycetota bacterium]|jgi:hypothetical protein
MKLDSPRTIRGLWIAGLILLSLLLVLDWTVHHHAHFEKDGITIDTLPNFFPVYGFLACFLLVIFSKTLSINLKRKDSYYDDD